MDHNLDVLAPLLPYNLYTQICLCYPLPPTSPSTTSITHTLTTGLTRLTHSYPYLASQIVPSNPTTNGPFKLTPFAKTPELTIKDLRHTPSAPTMASLRRAKFPSSMLDESIVAPRPTLPVHDSTSDSASAPAPVLVLQATFIADGLLLCILGNHTAMDMVGQGQIMHLLSKACRAEPFTDEELSSGNLPRDNLIPLLDEGYEPGPELAHQLLNPNTSSPPPPNTHDTPPPTPKYTRATILFPPSSLLALKTHASNTLPPQIPYISTDDALSAHLWQSVTRARLPRLKSTQTTTTFTRAVDVRTHLAIPPIYTGLMQNLTFTTSTPYHLVHDSPLGIIASRLRKSVDAETSNLAHATRALATMLHRRAANKTKSVVSLTGQRNLSIDVMLSSWAKVECHNLDFGLGLGNPEAVRRPQFEAVESLIYLMPRAADGEIAVAVCLREEDMERLRADEQFARYGEYIG